MRLPGELLSFANDKVLSQVHRNYGCPFSEIMESLWFRRMSSPVTWLGVDILSEASIECSTSSSFGQ